MAILANLSERRHVLVVVPRADELTWKSLRNAEPVHLLAPDQLNTYDVLVSDDVVFTRGALEDFLAGPAKSAATTVGSRHRGARARSQEGDNERRLQGPPRRAAGTRVSEKSYGLLDENKYTFLVHPDANKTEIKIAVEKVFGVKVNGVNTINRAGKRKRTRTGFGQRNATKRAIVTVAAGDRIDILRPVS